MINAIYRHIFCLVSIILLTVTNLVNAQHYRSSVIENTRATSVDRFSGVKVNEETLLFYSIIDETPGIYALDVNTDRVTKLISNPRAEYIEYVHFTKGDNEGMVDLLGLLYVTDGTVDGTRFIGDFGTQDIGNVTSTIVSNVWKKEFING